MGDVLSLIEKAEQMYDQKQAEEMEKKLRESSFTLEDYLEQFKQVRKMGSIDQIMAMLPGVKPGALKDAKIDEKQIDRMEAIILSMTKKERLKPDILNGSRKRRIAAGSGTSVEEVNKLLNQYSQVNKLMKQMSSGKLGMQLGDAGKQGFVEIGVVSAAQSLVGSQQDDGHPVHRTLLRQGRLIVAVGFEKIVDGQLQLFPVGCHATQSLLGFTQLCR